MPSKPRPRGRPRSAHTPLTEGSQRFNAWLRDRNLSLSEAAELIGVTHPQISRYARDVFAPPLAVAFKIEAVTKGAVPASAWASKETRVSAKG